MILVDTSVWIDHFRAADPRLVEILEAGEVLIHPFVVGELACGSLNSRSIVLAHLRRLPHAEVARTDEVLHLIEIAALFGKGLGYADCHLLASARLTGCSLWTKDRILASAAKALGIAQP
jgi:predicted nucleic acid-binding protein